MIIIEERRRLKMDRKYRIATSLDYIDKRENISYRIPK